MRGRGDKNDNHRHFNNMQRHSRLPRQASAATMALYNDKDTPGRLGAFRSTKGAALGSSYRTRTCFVRRGQMSPIMFPGARGRKSQNNSRTENTVSLIRQTTATRSRARARARKRKRAPLLDVRASGRPEDDSIRENGALSSALPCLSWFPLERKSAEHRGASPLIRVFIN